MVFKTPTKTPIKASPKPKLKTIKPHHHRRRKSTSPLKKLAAASTSALSASIKSCRRRLIKLFSGLPRKNGFHRLNPTLDSPLPTKKVGFFDLTLPPTCKKTLFLDLDETLVHSKTNPPPEKYDFKVYPVINGRIIPFYVLKRPGLEELLRIAVQSSFEIVVFTAGLEEYASQVLDQLDPTGEIFTHRLYRNSCREVEPGRYVKDLALTRRELDRVVIIDDNPNAYTLQPKNAIPVRPFVDDMGDSELGRLVRFFKVAGSYDDVRDAVRCFLSDSSEAVCTDIV